MSEPDSLGSRESGEYPRPFGNYLLLTSLARGGMGEVFLAKSGGIAGIEKHCVVKTLRGNYTMDREYVTRFIDEARVVVQLHHRNICQIYDVGRVGKQYYLAMEYIVGRDLRTIMQRAKDLSRPFARALVLHILAEMLEALDYAHRISDPITGEALRVVHRDVSPQNVMLNFEGEVKLIDFGLAQSAKKVEKTQPHVVMGKMAYMSPEQARGDPVDGRADQFAAAVLCYELLTGERYYEGLSFDQIWSMAGRGGHEPRLWNTLDATLREILGRALKPHATERYATCADFKDDLVTYQVKTGQLALSRDTRSFLSELFGDEAQAHRDMLARFQNVRMLSRESDLKSADESQSFSSTGDHESIISGAPIVDELTTVTHEPKNAINSKKTKAVSPLRPDEQTVSSLLVSQPSRSGRVEGSSGDRTYVENSPVPELTLVADRPSRSSGDATVFDSPDEASRTSPPTDARHEATEAVRAAPRASKPLAPTVILELPVEPAASPKPRRVGVMVIGLVTATVLLAVGVVWVLRPSSERSENVAAVVTPALATAAPLPTETEPATTEPERPASEPVVENPPVEAVEADPVDVQPSAPVEDTPPTPPAVASAAVEKPRPDTPPEPKNVVSEPRRGDDGERRPPRRVRNSKEPPKEAAAAAPTPPAMPRTVLAAPSPTMMLDTKLNWLSSNCTVSKLACARKLPAMKKAINQMAAPEIIELRRNVDTCIKSCVEWSKGN
jgi:serine/threonine protein kinase